MLKKLIQFQTSITPKSDKLGHFFWGFIYALISYFLGLWVFETQWTIIVLPFVLGGVKEYIDSRGKGTPEWMDFIFTIAPSIIIYFLI